MADAPELKFTTAFLAAVGASFVAYQAASVLAPLSLALFIIAIVWPLQRARGKQDGAADRDPACASQPPRSRQTCPVCGAGPVVAAPPWTGRRSVSTGPVPRQAGYLKARAPSSKSVAGRISRSAK